MPASGLVSVAKILIAVVLPAPFGPSMAYTPPLGTDRSRPSKARVVPKALTSPRASMAGEPVVAGDPRSCVNVVVMGTDAARPAGPLSSCSGRVFCLVS